ncbi:hypothetical protein B296_00001088 [Ensete ventricosum]|uniref:Uncharacterized protein n=1 Tax=Ensete ventricosum TaxID=4639 RepID=A0A426Y4C3_ENSVE|nr:hypothetical protein B296_00001088 [Ensete ventricosum]
MHPLRFPNSGIKSKWLARKVLLARGEAAGVIVGGKGSRCLLRGSSGVEGEYGRLHMTGITRVVIDKSCLPFRLSVVGRAPRDYTKMPIGSRSPLGVCRRLSSHVSRVSRDSLKK